MTKCQNCLKCKVRHWFMYCKMYKWSWEILRGSTLDPKEREVRPFLEVPKWTEKFSKDCKFYEEE